MARSWKRVILAAVIWLPLIPDLQFHLQYAPTDSSVVSPPTVLYSAGGSATVTTIPPFVVPREKLTCTNCIVRLTVKVPKGELSPGCQEYDTQTIDYPFTAAQLPPPQCGLLTPTNIYIGYWGTPDGCTPTNSECNSADNITFSSYPQHGYGLTCPPYSYLWVFGDGTTSTDEKPIHKYLTNGKHTVLLRVTDGSGVAAIINSVPSIIVNTTGVSGPRRRPARHP
jgi:PKD repeat protein